MVVFLASVTQVDICRAGVENRCRIRSVGDFNAAGGGECGCEGAEEGPCCGPRGNSQNRIGLETYVGSTKNYPCFEMNEARES